jgi:hypothetical protein
MDDLAAAGIPMPQYHPGAYPGPHAPAIFNPYRQLTGYQAAPMAPAGGVPYRRIMPTVPGAPALGFRDQSVGLGTVTFTATSGTTLTLSGSPGRPFKGRRLMFDVTRTGASATGLLTITAFNVGDVNQLIGTGALILNAFTPTSFGADGQYSACAPALTIRVGVTISSAPTMTDTVVVGGQINGETVGS